MTRTNALESLVIAGDVRGLSDRDVEATLADALGAEATLSKSTVSRVCEAIKTGFARQRRSASGRRSSREGHPRAEDITSSAGQYVTPRALIDAVGRLRAP